MKRFLQLLPKRVAQSMTSFGLLLATSSMFGQVAVTIPYTEDFTTNTWTISNGTQTNQWHIGSAAGNPANALYISNDAGATNAYTISSAFSVVHASKLITFPSITNNFSLEFDWKAMGENIHDRMRVWMIPEGATTTPGTPISTTNTPGAIRIGPNYLSLQASWKSEYFILANTTFAGTNWQLVFEWRNDSSVGTNPPAAVDNILVKEITCLEPTALALSNVTTSGFDISWTAGGTETSWDIEVGTTGFTPGTNTGIGSDTSNVANYSITDLTANTSYDVYVRADCGPNQSSWGTVESFTTLSADDVISRSDFTQINIKLFPNPTSDFVTISSEEAIKSVSVYNLIGQQILQNAEINNEQLDLRLLSSGTYLLKITLENGSSEMFKVVKR